MNGQKVTQVTEKMFEDYLALLTRRGKTEKTLASYRNILHLWYRTLPGDVVATADAGSRWEESLKAYGVAEATIRARLSVLSGFLTYLEDPIAAAAKGQNRPPEERDPDTLLSREEYRNLLCTARAVGWRRPYLLIKTMVCTGIRPQEFHALTVEGVRHGAVAVTSYGTSRRIAVPEPIRTELIRYAEQRGIEAGPIFITKDGTPMVHSGIWKEVKRVCRLMELPEGKGFPRSLYQLYANTKKELSQGSAWDAAERYGVFLAEEEALVGWEDTLS